MESWTPQEPAKETVPPRDAWGTWLSRGPLHHVTPDPRPAPARVGASAVLFGLFLFWGITAMAIWRIFV